MSAGTMMKSLALTCAGAPIIGPMAVEAHLRRKYGDSVVTPSKARNYLLAQQEFRANAVEVRSLPYILNLDTLDVCNLACPYCPTGTKNLQRKNKRLPLDQAKAVIDRIKDHVLEVRLYNWGEPFMNPEIFALIRYARDAGLFTVISSNLSIRVENFGERVVEAGLGRLHVSIDGLEQATLEKYRRGAEFTLVRENIGAVVEARRRNGSRSPEIELALLVFKHNEHEIGRLASLQREWDVDRFVPCRAFIYKKSDVPTLPEYQPMQKIYNNGCKFLYAELMVEADGHVSPCCSNTDSRFDVGTIEDLKDLRQFWNNPTYRAMRAVGTRRAAEFKDTETLCHHCRYIGKDTAPPGTLSPLPPAQYATGIAAVEADDMEPVLARVPML